MNFHHIGIFVKKISIAKKILRNQVKIKSYSKTIKDKKQNKLIEVEHGRYIRFEDIMKHNNPSYFGTIKHNLIITYYKYDEYWEMRKQKREEERKTKEYEEGCREFILSLIEEEINDLDHSSSFAGGWVL